MPIGPSVSLDADLLRRALAATSDCVTIADARVQDLPLIYVNAAFERTTGYSAEETLGSNCRFLQRGQASPNVTQTLRNSLARAIPCLVTLRNYRKDGSAFWNELSISPVRDSLGQVTHFIGIQKDVTARVEATRRLSKEKIRLESLNVELKGSVARDQLTGAFNRRHFQGALEAEWRRARRTNTSLACVLVLIDEPGVHGSPDRNDMVRAVAEALGHVVREHGDVLARYDNAEFAVLVSGLDLDSSLRLGEGLRNAVEAACIPHGNADSSETGIVTASVGVSAVVPSDEFSALALVSSADAALSDARNLGGNRVICGLMSAQTG